MSACYSISDEAVGGCMSSISLVCTRAINPVTSYQLYSSK